MNRPSLGGDVVFTSVIDIASVSDFVTDVAIEIVIVIDIVVVLVIVIVVLYGY